MMLIMVAVVIWIFAWIASGGESFAVGDGWFWFLVACSVLSFSQAVATSRIGQTSVLVSGEQREESASE